MSMKRILLVDDQATVLRVLRLSLEKAGYFVDTAANGQEALQKIKSDEPDALITDIEMPVMDGRELCQTLERDLPDRSFPIFLATSLTGVEHRGWSAAISNMFFMEKPVSARMLTAKLSDYFTDGQTQTMKKLELT